MVYLLIIPMTVPLTSCLEPCHQKTTSTLFQSQKTKLCSSTSKKPSCRAAFDPPLNQHQLDYFFVQERGVSGLVLTISP